MGTQGIGKHENERISSKKKLKTQHFYSVFPLLWREMWHFLVYPDVFLLGGPSTDVVRSCLILINYGKKKRAFSNSESFDYVCLRQRWQRWKNNFSCHWTVLFFPVVRVRSTFQLLTRKSSHVCNTVLCLCGRFLEIWNKSQTILEGCFKRRQLDEVWAASFWSILCILWPTPTEPLGKRAAGRKLYSRQLAMTCYKELAELHVSLINAFFFIPFTISFLLYTHTILWWTFDLVHVSSILIY